jgi:hypothetical protein
MNSTSHAAPSASMPEMVATDAATGYRADAFPCSYGWRVNIEDESGRLITWRLRMTLPATMEAVRFGIATAEFLTVEQKRAAMAALKELAEKGPTQ